MIVDGSMHVHDVDLGKHVANADFKVIRIVRRSDLYTTRSEFLIDVVVGNDRDLAVHEGKPELAAYKFFITLISRIDCNSHVAKHGLRAGCCNDDPLRFSSLTVDKRI